MKKILYFSFTSLGSVFCHAFTSVPRLMTLPLSQFHSANIVLSDSLFSLPFFTNEVSCWTIATGTLAKVK